MCNMPEGWYYQESGQLGLDPPMYKSFYKALKKFKQLQKEGACAVLSCYCGEKNYAVYDESPILNFTNKKKDA